MLLSIQGFLSQGFSGRSARATVTALALLGALTSGCTNSASTPGEALNISMNDVKEIRALTSDEALSDYDAMIASINALYGPLEYKERRFGYNFQTEAQTLRKKLASAKTDFDKQAVFYELLRKLEDGHVSLSQPLRERHEIPIIVMPVEDKVIVTRLDPSLAPYGIAAGDEILTVDGITPTDALAIIKKYTWFANEESDKHLIYFFFVRPAHLLELVPSAPYAQIEFAKPDGTKKLARIAWKRTSPQSRLPLEPRAGNEPGFPLFKSDFKAPARATLALLNSSEAMTSKALSERLEVEAGIADMGAAAPWYWNPMLKRRYGVTMVTPERERVEAFYSMWFRELNPFGAAEAPEPIPAELPLVWAALYKYNAKTVLMFRQPSYGAPNFVLNLAIYSALIEQYQPIADVLIVDQTHNPGGSVTYVEGFSQLFAPEGLNNFVQFLNADRLWFNRLTTFWTSLDAATAASAIGTRVFTTAKGIERDSEAGLRLTKDPFAFSLREVLPAAPGGVVWKKPILVLVDELCGSGGDAFPMLMKANGLAKVFGNRTMGLGGSVEKIIDLPFTRAELRLTRGLFTTFKPDGIYLDSDFIENNGVTPDVQYTHTVKDVRGGFDAYFNAFSAEATK